MYIINRQHDYKNASSDHPGSAYRDITGKSLQLPVQNTAKWTHKNRTECGAKPGDISDLPII